MQTKRILVTSGAGGVGKSSVAAHLASALAERGARVLLADLCTTGRSLDLLAACTPSLLYDIGDLLCSRIDASRVVVPLKERNGLFLLPGAFKFERTPTLPELLRAIRVAEEAIGAEYTVFDSHFGTLALRAASVSDLTLIVTDTTPASLRAAAEAALSLPTATEGKLVVNRFPCYPRVKSRIPSVLPWLNEIRLPLIAILPDSLTAAESEAAGDGISLKRDNLSRAYRSLAARIAGENAPLCLTFKKLKIKRRRLIKSLIG